MLKFTDDKKGAILKASFEVFITYGFRKTSMDDIARAVGMSRPALYQSFKNKTDIFRALSSHFCEASLNKAEAQLNSDQEFATRLTRAIEVSVIEMNKMVESTPHAVELMSVNDEIAHDLEEIWDNRFTSILSDAFAKADADGEIDLSAIGIPATEVAQVFHNAMEGLKVRCMRGEKVTDAIYTTVLFFANTLSTSANRSGSDFKPVVAQIA